METHEDSPGRLRSKLTRSRRAKDDSPIADMSDRASLNGDAADNRLSRSGGLDGAVSDTAEPKISKLIPGHSKRKEKKRKAQQAAEDEANRGRSSLGANALPSTSLSTLESQNEAEGGSNMMTSESEDEGEEELSGSTSLPPRPGPQESHAGYLTSTSPNVEANSLVDVSATNTTPGMPRAASPSRSTTLPASAHAKAASGPAHTLSHGTSMVSLNSADSARSEKARSTSPGNRLKLALKPSSKKSSDSDLRGSSSGSNPSKPEGFGSKRASKRADSIPHMPTNPAQHLAAHQSNKSLPSIITTPVTPPPLPTKTFEKFAAAVIPPSPADDFAISSPVQQEEQPAARDTKELTSSPVSITQSIHRRMRSDSQPHAPSKLSQSMNPPITPTVEEGRTPGTRNISMASSSGGFFTSVFSAAQNAATTLTTTLGNNPRSRSGTTGTTGTQPTVDSKSREASPAVDAEPKAEPAVGDNAEPAKSLAIDTIGSGDLSLSHLGISNDEFTGATSAPGTPQPDASHSRSRSGTVVHTEASAAREEDISAARAVSAAYGDKILDAVTPLVEDVALPLKSAPPATETSPVEGTPNGSIADGEPSTLNRSASLKNKLDRTRRRRRRDGSQSTAGGTLSGSSLLGSSNPNAPKLTGFAVASKKRNKDFHALFKSVPEGDYLIEDYSCALQRDIILAGRIYISEGHVCFSSNILGWVTSLVISFDEVVSVEKESTAMVFPNAIAIQTLHSRHTFRSLLSREATYDLLIGIWKINHPGLQSSENGTKIANGTGSKTEKIGDGGSEDGSDGSDDEGLDDEDDGSDSEGEGSGVLTGEGSIAASEGAPSPPKSAIPKKPSNIGMAAGQAATPGPAAVDGNAAVQTNGAASASADFPGPATHAPTQCADSATHYQTLLKDDIIAAPLGKVYTLIFGPASGGFMSRWLVDDQKSMDLSFEDDKKGLGEEVKSRSYTYIKPLPGPIGPRQTKCTTTENLDAFDLEKAVSVTATTQTPDVPSGNVFSVKTRYCLMWAPNNSTRMVASCTIEWTGKSWLKGPIEKGANDGQTTYVNELIKAIRAAASKGKAAGGAANGKAKKGKKKKTSDTEQSTSSLPAAKPKSSDWGPLEPIHALFEPVTGILGPLFNVYALVVLLSVLLVISWFRSPQQGPRSAVNSLARTPTSQRIAAYEELWRAEEAALWTWLEERIGGAEGLAVPVSSQAGSNWVKSNADRSRASQRERQQVLRGEGGVGSMSEKEVQRAVEITEEKLRLLKQAASKVQGTEGKSEL